MFQGTVWWPLTQSSVHKTSRFHLFSQRNFTLFLLLYLYGFSSANPMAEAAPAEDLGRSGLVMAIAGGFSAGGGGLRAHCHAARSKRWREIVLSFLFEWFFSWFFWISEGKRKSTTNYAFFPNRNTFACRASAFAAPAPLEVFGHVEDYGASLGWCRPGNTEEELLVLGFSAEAEPRRGVLSKVKSFAVLAKTLKIPLVFVFWGFVFWCFLNPLKDSSSLIIFWKERWGTEWCWEDT